MYPLEDASKGAAAILSLENGERSDAEKIIANMTREELAILTRNLVSLHFIVNKELSLNTRG